MALKIAHIDDDPADQILVSSHIKGHDIKCYDSYEDFIKSTDDYDFIICDLNMPDYSMDNLSAAAQKYKAPFIVYSGTSPLCFNKSNIEFMRKMGVLRFLEKETDIDRLANIVERVAVKSMELT